MSNRSTPNSYLGQPAVVSTVWPNFPCAFRVSREDLRVHGRGLGVDLGVTYVLLPCYYRVNQVGATREEFPECMENFHTLGELLAVWPRVLLCVTVWSGVS